jgi:RNA polymerase sigma factor (TIGR02999 family)
MSAVMTSSHDITLLLRQIDDGLPGAMDELMRMVYADLERMAASYLRKHFGDRMRQITLEPAALVNESFLRLIKQRKSFDNRGQFFAIATKIMLRVLIDYQRQKLASKRGGAGRKGDSGLTLMLDDRRAAGPQMQSAVVQIEDLASALERLEALDARKADIVKMRVVWGMTVPEVAEALDVSPSSVDRDWRFAKAWIADEVGLTEQ